MCERGSNQWSLQISFSLRGVDGRDVLRGWEGRNVLRGREEINISRGKEGDRCFNTISFLGLF